VSESKKCPTCFVKGEPTGLIWSKEKNCYQVCPDCHGTGFVPENLELTQGRVYRAKKPATCSGSGYLNDRQIIHLSSTKVQYDGPAVKNGRHYPSVSREDFIKWAGKDVTDSMPHGEWQLSPRFL
jgi:hypothetical protein